MWLALRPFFYATQEEPVSCVRRDWLPLDSFSEGASIRAKLLSVFETHAADQSVKKNL
jgi:hypothetical protein